MSYLIFAKPINLENGISHQKIQILSLIKLNMIKVLENDTRDTSSIMNYPIIIHVKLQYNTQDTEFIVVYPQSCIIITMDNNISFSELTY